jgi:hypothetical protein
MPPACPVSLMLIATKGCNLPTKMMVMTDTSRTEVIGASSSTDREAPRDKPVAPQSFFYTVGSVLIRLGHYLFSPLKFTQNRS